MARGSVRVTSKAHPRAVYAYGKSTRQRRYQSTYQRRPRAAYVQTMSATDELKFHDLDIDDAAIAVAGTIAEDSILTIAQGDGESERLGRKCVVKKIGWKFEILLAPQADLDLGVDVVRVILYHDKQTNGAAAVATDLLETDDYQSFNNLSNKGRFTTLMDRTYDLTAPAGAGGDSSGPLIVSDSFYKDCNMPIEYDNSATTGVIATMRSNNIGVLLLSKLGRAGFASKMRVRFVG